MNTVKFTVFDTNSGKSLEMEIPSNGSIEIVKNKVNDVFFIDNKYQILLFGSENEKYKTLNSLNTVEILNGKNIFLYNRSNLSMSADESMLSKKMKLSTIFEQEEFPQTCDIIYNIQNVKNENEIIKGPDPIKNSLIVYKSQFEISIKKNNNFINYVNKFCKSIEDSIKENKNYLEATKAVVTNLLFYNDEINISINFFKEKNLEFTKINCELINNFDNDINELSKIELHKNIKNEKYTKLIDYINVDNIKIKYKEYKFLYENYKNKIQEFFNNYEIFDNKIKKLNEMKEYFCIKEKVKNINIKNYKNDIENINIINNNLKIHIKLILKALNSNDKIVLETCHNMDNIFYNYKNYEKNFEMHMEITFANLQDILNLLNSDIKKQCLENLNKTIHEVSIYQNEIVKIKNLFFVFDNTSTTIKNNFDEVNIISKMSEAYKESLNEIIRRKKFKNRYISKINFETEELLNMYEEEIKNRELFKNKYDHYLPKKYINFDVLPTKIEISLKDFDENLPEIEDNSEIIQDLVNEIIDNVFKEIPENISVIYSDSEEDSETNSKNYLEYFKNKIEYENKLLERIKELENEIKELKNVK